MTPSLPPQDLAAQWTTARKLYPLYVELAREFVIDLPSCSVLESGEEQPDREGVEQIQRKREIQGFVLTIAHIALA